MSSIRFKADVLPHLIAVIVFLLLTAIMYHPILFENKTLIQNDINQGRGAASELVEHREKTGEEALWTNSMFSGMPAYLISVHWTGEKFLNIVQDIITLYLPGIVRENLLAFVTFYILLLAFGVNPYLAIGGAIAFGLNTFYVVSIEAGHMWKVRAIAYMPLVLAGIHLVFRGKRLLGFILTALALALEINANHLQITYYLALLVGIYGISQLVFALQKNMLSQFAVHVGLLFVAVALALAVNLGKIWATVEYGDYSIRGQSELQSEDVGSGLDRDYAFAWSNGVGETFTLLVPHLYGGASGLYLGDDSELADLLRRNNYPPAQIEQAERGLLGYWGPQPFTSGPVYIGVIAIMLFIYGFLLLGPQMRWWLLAVFVISIMLSWGKNFAALNNFLFDVLPGYNKFRAVTMTIVMALIAIPLMGFAGLQKLLEHGWNPRAKKNLWIALGITGGIVLLIALLADPPAIEQDAVIANAVQDDRISVVRSDAIRSIIFLAVGFSIFFFWQKGTLKPIPAVALVALIIATDLLAVNKRYLNADNFTKRTQNNYLAKTPADEYLEQNADGFYRVFDLQNPFNQARTSNFHQSIGGYHGAKIRRYQDLIDQYLEPARQQILEDKGLNAANTKILSMLNAQYVLAGYQKEAVLPNPYALGNAWFVENIREVTSPDEELAALANIDPARTAVVDVSKFDVDISPVEDSTASIALVSYQPNHLVYEAQNSFPAVAVFSEVYYPNGWTATIDGEEVDVFRANYILRALEVPAGTHTIEFRFEPRVYAAGNSISGIATILFLLIIAGALVRLYLTTRTTKRTEDEL
jgi:hypothetical protein